MPRFKQINQPRLALAMLAMLGASLTAAACGASSAEIKKSKAATYSCTAEEILETSAKILVDRVAPIAGIDRERGIVVTKFRWHDQNGRRKNVEETVVNQGDVFTSVQVQIKPGEFDRFRLSLDSEVQGHVTGSPQPVPLPPGNAARPAWVGARDDELRVSIYKALSRCVHDGAT